MKCSKFFIISKFFEDDQKFAAIQKGSEGSSLFFSFNYTSIQNNETFIELIDFFENKMLKLEQKGQDMPILNSWFFHAARHFPYAECSWIHLWIIRTSSQQLSEQHYEAYEPNYTFRRSDMYISRISTDQTIMNKH